MQFTTTIGLTPHQRTQFAEGANTVGLQRLRVEFADIYMRRLAIPKAANVMYSSAKAVATTEVNEA